MRGNPKTLNSKYDFLYAKEHLDVSFWLPYWKGLLESRYIWFPTKTLASKEEGIEDETHMIEEMSFDGMDGEEAKVEYRQLELIEDEHSTFKTLGFTEEEVKAAIAEGEAKLAEQGAA